MSEEKKVLNDEELENVSGGEGEAKPECYLPYTYMIRLVDYEVCRKCSWQETCANYDEFK